MDGKGKAAAIAEFIVERIKGGGYPRASLIPSERRLASEFGVSHMTARKAVDSLVSGGYLERRQGDGTYVKSDLAECLAGRQLGLALPAWDSPEISDVLIHASRIASAEGWLPRPFYLKSWTDKAMDDALDSCEAVIALPPEGLDKIPKRLMDRFLERRPPFVVMGLPAYVVGLDCSTGSSGMPLAVDRLIDAGHKRIAVVFQRFGEPESILPYGVYIEEWRSRVAPIAGKDCLDGLLLEIEVPRFELPHAALKSYLLELFRKNGGSLPFTAIIAPVSMAWGALSAFHELGLKVPEDVSLLATGDRLEAEFYVPRMEMVKISWRTHVANAWDALKERLLEGPSRKEPICRFMCPELVPGETIANLR